jgi:DNA repair protein RecO (recombination protein O)
MVEPFTHIHGQFAEGRDLAYLNEVALIYPFAGLRESLTALEVGGHWLQLIYRSVAFEQESGAIFTLLLRALKKLETASSFTVLDLWVQLRLLGLLGVGPELRQCCQCGDTEVVVFHPTSGGMLCAACGSGRMKTGPAALDTLRRLQECRYSAVANLCLEKELSSTLAALLQKTFEAHCFSG